MRASQDPHAQKHATAHVRGYRERREEASRISDKELKAILRSRRLIKDLARAFGVSTETMALIRSGKL